MLTHCVTSRGRNSSCSHFPDEEPEVQRGEVSNSWSLRRRDLNPLRACALTPHQSGVSLTPVILVSS